MDCLTDILSGHTHHEYDEDTDSGLEESALSSFSLEGYDVATQTFSTSQSQNYLTQSDATYDEEYDLSYVDDLNDNDYKPHRTGYMPKKDKGQHSRRYHCPGRPSYERLMCTPEKIISGSEDSCSSSLRHYARKDRSPQTIKRMMEKHRESERLRHHTLNESMKDVCMRVPGYDPHVKETKVIQMQRVIAYECFLENTLTSLGTQLGLLPKLLRTSTSFITDAMKETPIEEFYQPSVYKTSDLDECEEESQHNIVKRSYRPKYKKTSYFEKSDSKYRHKISSPTIDSTTDNVIKIYPLSHSTQGSTFTLSQENLGHTHGFVPIESSQVLFSSQESKLRNSGNEEIQLQELDTLIDPGLSGGREVQDATPSFMKDECDSSPTYVDEDSAEFSFSSPGWTSSNPYIYSPASSGVWQTGSGHGVNKVETPSGKEMQSVAPDHILQTTSSQTRSQDNFSSPSSSTCEYPYSEVIYPSYIIGSNTMATMSPTDDLVPSSSSDCLSSYSFDEYNQMMMSNFSDSKTKKDPAHKIYGRHLYKENVAGGQGHVYGIVPDAVVVERNKRKQYTPLKSTACVPSANNSHVEYFESSPPRKQKKRNFRGRNRENKFSFK